MVLSAVLGVAWCGALAAAIIAAQRFRRRGRRDVRPPQFFGAGPVSRGSGFGTRADEAAFATLHTISLASPPLRRGLTDESARKTARHLRVLLGAEAIALTDDSRLLIWDGAGARHAGAVYEQAATVIESGRPRVVRGGDLACDDPACRIRAGVLAPLIIDGRVCGVLAAYGPDTSAARVRAVGQVARWMSSQLELAELDSSRTRLIEAEMKALRAQISPHFVYNSLTTIASFVRTDPERARELLLDFADFARYSFRDPRTFTTLAEELRSIDRYLLLERARFGECLRFTFEIAPEVLSVAVPFLSLQPLVENAIRHGMEASRKTFHIRIVARDAGTEARISVEDDGVGMDPGRLRAVLAGGRGAAGGARGDAPGTGHGSGHSYGPRLGSGSGSGTGTGTGRRHGNGNSNGNGKGNGKGNGQVYGRAETAGTSAVDGDTDTDTDTDGDRPRVGIGLANVDERLRQLYGDGYGLSVDTFPGAGTRVNLRIPKSRPGRLGNQMTPTS